MLICDNTRGKDMSFQRLLNISRRSMRLENKSEDGMAEGKDKGFVQCDFVEHLAWPQHLQENMQEVSDILRTGGHSPLCISSASP